jgi:ubiquinol-cytochrome c reductase cytochrome b subunit
MFYTFKTINDIQTKIKIIPLNIEEYLTPLALAIWFMDDGSKIGKGAKIATNCFTYNEIIFLSEVLYKKYNIKTSVISSGINKGYTLYISTTSMSIFIKLIKPFMLPSLYYKLNITS